MILNCCRHDASRSRTGARIAIVLLLVVTGSAAGGCRPATSEAPVHQAPPPAPAPAAPAAAEATPMPMQDLETADLLQLNERLTGDFDQMQKRRFVRALVPYSRTYYFLDRATQRGLAYDVLTEFERTLAARAPKGTVPPKIVIIPTSRDRLLPALAEGYGDVAIGGFTVTEARRTQVDFSDPTRDDIRDLIVTGADAPAVSRIEDLSGREVHVRKSSSYHEDLVALNERFAREGRPAAKIVAADELLEDEDLIEMADAGIVPITVMKDLTAGLWAQLYTGVTVHDELVLRDAGQMAVAVRKGTPEFLAIVNDFVRSHRKGTTFGNMMFKRYFGDARRLKNPTAVSELRKFRTLVQHFQKYGGQYDFDWILIGAQGYQESQLDQSRRSAVGAVGIMQIKPDTAADKNVGIPDIYSVEHNIQAGTKYMRFMVDRYFADAPMDRLNKGLFALASYNAGPARVARLRAKAQQMGLNPNVWFRNVEMVAAREIGRETVDYVSNIYKYYTAYKSVVERRAVREKTPVGRSSRQ